MFGKLLAIILTTGITAAALLVIRHQRLEAGHRLTSIYRDMLRHEHALWELRAEIAERTSPEEVRRRLEELPQQWRPIPDPDLAIIDLEAAATPDAGLVTLDPDAEAAHAHPSLSPG